MNKIFHVVTDFAIKIFLLFFILFDKKEKGFSFAYQGYCDHWKDSKSEKILADIEGALFCLMSEGVEVYPSCKKHVIIPRGLMFHMHMPFINGVSVIDKLKHKYKNISVRYPLESDKIGSSEFKVEISG